MTSARLRPALVVRAVPVVVRPLAVAVAVLVVCAPGGLAVAAEPVPSAAVETDCATADALASAHRLDAAAAAYERLSAGPRTRVCAAAGFARLGAAWVERAEALRSAGRTADARTALSRAVELQPHVDVPVELRALAESPRRDGRWAWLQVHAGQVGAEVVQVLTGLVGVLLAVTAALWLAARTRRSVHVEAWPDEGAALGRLLGVELHRLTSSGAVGASLDVVGPYNETAPVPAQVGTAVPQAALVAAVLALLDRLLPHRRRVLTGAMTLDGGVACGATAVMSRHSGARVALTALWLDDDVVPSLSGGAPQWARLAQPLAVWALYASCPRQARALGSSDWRSYALTAAAATDQAGGVGRLR